MSQKVTVKVGNYEVIDSGVVSVVDESPITLTLDPKIIVSIVFQNDANEKNQSIKSVVKDNRILEYTLINFNNPLGTEFTQIAKIGTYNGRDLLFHIKVLGNGNAANKTVFYSFYSGGQVTNG